MSSEKLTRVIIYAMNAYATCTSSTMSLTKLLLLGAV